MTILHVITSLRTGGAERLVTDLLLHLRGEGAEVALLLLDGTRTGLYEEVEAAGIPVRSLSKGWKAMWNPLLLLKMVRFLRKNPSTWSIPTIRPASCWEPQHPCSCR